MRRRTSRHLRSASLLFRLRFMNLRLSTALSLLAMINGAAVAAPPAKPAEAPAEKPAVTALRLTKASVVAPLFVPQPRGGYAAVPVTVTALATAATATSPG